MAEQADAPVSNTGPERGEGSIPSRATHDEIMAIARELAERYRGALQKMSEWPTE